MSDTGRVLTPLILFVIVIIVSLNSVLWSNLPGTSNKSKKTDGFIPLVT